MDIRERLNSFYEKSNKKKAQTLKNISFGGISLDLTRNLISREILVKMRGLLSLSKFSKKRKQLFDNQYISDTESQKVSFVSLLENIEVDPARPSARVIVNSRTGTIVIGGDVRVTPSVVTHGSLTVRINEDKEVVQANNIAQNQQGVVVAPGQAQVNDDTEIIIEEEPARAFIFDPGIELSDVVDAVNGVGASPADLVAILEALREAGSLRAEIIVI